MENVIFKYSDFFKDDGGMERVKTQFIKLGDDLIAKAKEVKEKTKLIDVDNLEQFNKLEKETEELIKTQKQYADSLKKIDALEKKLVKSRVSKVKGINAETEALRKSRVEARAVAKIQNTTKNSIENLRAKLSLVTIAWTKLTSEEIKNTSRGKRLNESKKQLTATLRGLEKATGDHRRGVADYDNRLGKLRGSLVGVASAMGVTLGLFGAFRVIRSSINIVKEYEKANATLAGILNKTKEETIELREQSKFLGSTTVRTASEVVQLQTAYARLGFTQEEILELAKPTIDGSIALNASLEDTAELVGAVVNSYDDLTATDTAKILETLTASTTKSALTFDKLATQLPIVLGAANALNIPLEEVTATLGKLADSGIDASSGATSLRNIFIESAKRGLNYKDALKEITKSQDKLTTANKLFGKRAAISALVIANNTAGVAELAKELDSAAVVSNLVENELNTLDGSVKLLTSAWEGLVLSLNDATGGGNALSSSIRFLAENLQTIFKVIAIATTTFISYNLAIRLSNTLTKANILWTKGATIATNLKTIATRTATVAQQAFNSAVKANPIGLLVALLATAVTAYLFFRDATTSAEKAQIKLNEAKKEGIKIGIEVVKAEREVADKRIQLLDQEIKIRKARGEDSKKLDAEFKKRKISILEEEVKRNQAEIDTSLEATKALRKQLEERLNDIKENTKKELLSRKGTSAQQFEFINQQERLRNREILINKEAVGKILGVIESRNKTIASLNDELITLDEELLVKEVEIGKKRLKELSVLQRRLEDLKNEAIKDDEDREIKQIETKFKREIEAIKGNTQIEIDLRKQLEEAKFVEIQKIRDKFRLKREKELQDFELFELTLIKDSTEKLIAQEKKRSEQVLKAIKESVVIQESERTKLIIQERKKSSDIITKIEIDAELKRLNNSLLISEAKIDQQKGFFKKEEEFEKFKAKKLSEIQIENLKKQLEALNKFQGEIFDVQKEQIKAQITDLENQFKVDPFEKLGESIREVFVKVFDNITTKQRQAVKNSQKLLNDQEKAVDTQQRRAEQGLENQLAFEQRELGKREAELVKRQKKQERLEKIKAIYSAYNNYASQGDTNPLVKALRDFALLEAITASFGDGGVVEDKLPSSGIFRGQSHQGNKGGIPIMVEGKEGIFSSREMENLGKDNFYKMKDLASMGKIDSNFFSGQGQKFIQAVPVDRTNHQLINELKEVKQAIQAKPTQNWDVPGFADGVMEMVETIVTKNKTVRNHYKTRKSLRS